MSQYINYKGKIIMNGYLHDYDENYHLEQYKTTRIQSVTNFHDWCISIDNAYYGQTSISQNNYILFRIEIGIIIAPNDFMKYITDNYFSKYNDKCEYKKFKLMSDDYKYYVCNKDIELHDFIIGSVLMKTYDFVFDKFKSNIGFYDLSIQVKTKTKNNLVIYIVVISVLSVLIILLIIYLIWKYCNKPRISRKNELDDDYNYITGSITDDKKISPE